VFRCDNWTCLLYGAFTITVPKLVSGRWALRSGVQEDSRYCNDPWRRKEAHAEVYWTLQREVTVAAPQNSKKTKLMIMRTGRDKICWGVRWLSTRAFPWLLTNVTHFFLFSWALNSTPYRPCPSDVDVSGRDYQHKGLYGITHEPVNWMLSLVAQGRTRHGFSIVIKLW